jgi:hypothetical protein
MELKLNDLEAEALRETLRAELSRLLMEIANTDDRKMKDGLRRREGLIRAILEKIPAEIRGAA